MLSLIIVTMLIVSTFSPTLAAFDWLNTELPKTQTVYELATIELKLPSNARMEQEIELLSKAAQEFKSAAKSFDDSRLNSILEVRYASVYSVGRETARRYGYDKYQNVIDRLVARARMQGLELSSNIDDLALQEFAKAQLLSTPETDSVGFAKFIDIYENYAYNDEIRKIVASLGACTFASAREIITDGELYVYRVG